MLHLKINKHYDFYLQVFNFGHLRGIPSKKGFRTIPFSEHLTSSDMPEYLSFLKGHSLHFSIVYPLCLIFAISIFSTSGVNFTPL